MPHSFFIDRQLLSVGWVDFWSEETKLTVAFRAACSCGWTGQAVSGHLARGEPDEASKERAYEVWDRLHCPDWEARHPDDPDRQ